MQKVGYLKLISAAAIFALLAACQSIPHQPLVLLKPTNFSSLPGWQSTDPTLALTAYKTSCLRIVNLPNYHNVGSSAIPLAAGSLKASCRAAFSLPNDVMPIMAKAFFATWFQPMLVTDNGQAKGLFTGYYMPTINGSLSRHGRYTIPIYAKPATQYARYFSREQIAAGALKGRAPILMWTDDKIGLFFMQIQGSGVVELTNGRRVLLGFAGRNDLPYTPIGRVLVEQRQIAKSTVSMQSIQQWLISHPRYADAVMNTNASYVFFRVLALSSPLGAERVTLTPGYSLAVDHHFIPYGLPLWLATKVPDVRAPAYSLTFQRLLIAQDTGGAIRGPVRGDIYWGSGDAAAILAGHMQHSGRYWLFLPK